MITVHWIDSGREPRAAPNPEYPDGIHLDLSNGAERVCEVKLEPYPTRRCGLFVLKCDVCGMSAGITTAGRPDDPRSAKLACKT
jgi:hypothetical protein